MLGKLNFLNELLNMDPELYNSLKFLKTYEGHYYHNYHVFRECKRSILIFCCELASVTRRRAFAKWEKYWSD